MSAGVSVVTYSVAAENAAELATRVRDHLVPAARTAPGYQGMALLDLGDGKRMAILLFDSVEQVAAGQAILTPVGREHTYGLMSVPAVGVAGTVLIADGVFQRMQEGA